MREQIQAVPTVVNPFSRGRKCHWRFPLFDHTYLRSTDKLVELADNDNQLLVVMAHKRGNFRNNTLCAGLEPVAAYEAYPTVRDTSIVVVPVGVLENDGDKDSRKVRAVMALFIPPQATGPRGSRGT